VTSSGSVGKGALLLFFYSIGQSFLVAAAGLFTSRLKAFLEIEKNIGALEYMRKIGGLFIALLGLYVILRPHI
jgi:cytochrome c biogenesis protein CcdA